MRTMVALFSAMWLLLQPVRAAPLSAYDVYHMPYFDAYVLNDVQHIWNSDWYSVRYVVAGGEWRGTERGSVTLGVLMVAHPGYLISSLWAANGTYLYAGIPGGADSLITLDFSPGGTFTSFSSMYYWGNNGGNDFAQSVTFGTPLP